jgi:ABC-2 type transport system ATP-binding protein
MPEKQKHNIISVKNLTKRFSSGTAVDAISFDVQRGEMLGLLGPNGAGKTTTIRILAGYLAATEGSVKINGLDILEHSHAIRKRIGYLPENVALYPEMRVEEYLRFRARLKGMGRRRLRNRINEVLSLCGLHEVANRIIGHLSRGYHQRVGLADSLVHEPELLLLDEPTIGLDPNQNRLIRKLVRTLSQRHTVVLSTHFLAEAETLCSRVLILHHGKIVASDAPSVLTSLSKNETIIKAEIAGRSENILSVLRALPEVFEVEVNPCEKAAEAGAGQDWNQYTIACDTDTDIRSDIFTIAARQGWHLRELRLEKKKLEDAFAEITGTSGTNTK